MSCKIFRTMSLIGSINSFGSWWKYIYGKSNLIESHLNSDLCYKLNRAFGGAQ